MKFDAKFYNDILDSIQDGISILDRDLRIIMVNRTMEKWYAHNMPLIGKKCHEAYYQRKDMCEICPAVKTLSHGAKEFDIVPLMGKDGVKGWLELYSYPLIDSVTKEVVGVIEYLKDISEIRAAEETTHRLSAIVEQAAEGIAVASPDGKVTFANNAWLNMHGYEIDEVTGRGLDIFHTPQQMVDDVEPFNREVMRKGSHRGEVGHKRKDGSTFPAYMVTSKLKDIDDRIIGIVGFAVDITEIKKAEEELKRSESRMRDILNAIPDIMFRIGRDGVFKDCNFPEGTALYARPEAFMGRKISDVMPMDIADRAMIYIKAAHSTGRPQSFEYSLDIEGAERQYEARLVTSGPDDVIAMVRDITEHRALEEHYRHAQKMEAIGVLTGGIAHEFNNIITSITGFSELLLDILPGGSTGRQYVEFIKASGERASKLTGSLLAYSRKNVTNFEQTNVNKLIIGIRDFLAKLIGEDILLMISPSREDLIVLADKSQMEQVVINLATNAISAMPRGGTLTIGTGKVRAEEIPALANQVDGGTEYAFITVTDTGEGIDSVHLDKIFEPFFTTKDVGKGTGLGLSVVYGIVTKHGGHIDVRSVVGTGTAFTIFIPLCEEVHGSSETASEEVPPKGRGTILVAEDDELVRQFIRRALIAGGYEVIEAANGQAAVDAFIRHRDEVSLLLFDVAMPIKNGVEAYKEISAMSPDVKTVFMSGYSENELNEHQIDKKKFVFLGKPLSVGELHRTLYGMLF